MLLLMLLGLVASASTGAWYDPFDFTNGFQLKMNRFWDNFHKKMDNLNENIENVIKKSKNREKSTIEGNEYKVVIYLTGFNKEDIVVKAKKGNLVIQAIHNVPGGAVNNYLNVRSLPDFVDVNGSWSYNNGKLIIIFPILQHESNNMTEIILPYVDNKKDKPNDDNSPVATNDGT